MSKHTDTTVTFTCDKCKEKLVLHNPDKIDLPETWDRLILALEINNDELKGSTLIEEYEPIYSSYELCENCVHDLICWWNNK